MGQGRSHVMLCEECGHESEIQPPDYVVMRSDQVACLMCGDSYTWNMPVPFSIVIAGSLAYGYDHLDCRERRDKWRVRLLRTLLADSDESRLGGHWP